MQFHLIYVHWNSLYKNWWRRWAVATLIYNKMRHEWDDIYLNSFNVSVSTRLKVYCLIFSYFFKKGEILHFLNIAKNKEDGKQVLLFFNLWYESRKKIIHSDEKEKKGDSSIKNIVVHLVKFNQNYYFEYEWKKLLTYGPRHLFNNKMESTTFVRFI